MLLVASIKKMSLKTRLLRQVRVERICTYLDLVMVVSMLPDNSEKDIIFLQLSCQSLESQSHHDQGHLPIQCLDHQLKR